MERYWPFSSGAGASATEVDWGTMQRAALTSGVVRGQTNDANKGNIAQELRVFADSTGMQCKVPVGEASLRGFYYQNDVQLTLPLTAAHATLPRVDYAVVKLDLSARTIAATVKAGTPNASPVAPSLTQSGSVWEIPLATIAVGAAVSTINSGNVTDQRLYARPPGGALAWVSFTAPAGTITVLAAVNVISISRTAAGQYILNLRAGATNGTYAISGMASDTAYISNDGGSNSATNAYFFVNNAAGTQIDPGRCLVMIGAGDF